MLPLLVIVDQHRLSGLVDLAGGALIDGVARAQQCAGRPGGDDPDPFGAGFVEQKNAAGRCAGDLSRFVDNGLQQVHDVASVHDFQRRFVQKRQQFIAALQLSRRVFLMIHLV